MVTQHKHWFVLLGFLLFITGMLGFIINLVGLQLQIFKWIDNQGFLFATVIKATMIVIGLSLVYILKFNRNDI